MQIHSCSFAQSLVTSSSFFRRALLVASLPLIANLFVSSACCLGHSTGQEASTASETTLGMSAPEGAVVLFDGSGFDAWKPFSFQSINPRDDQKEIQWKLVDGNAMQIAFEHQGKNRKQFIETREKFADYKLHLEFCLPDNGAGNSGLFFGPLYEIQILNSAGKKKPGLTDCGAIYQIRVPDSNAALGPGQWQTVDLEYQSAKPDKRGYLTEKNVSRVTVRLNNVLVHDNFKLSVRRNKYAAYPEKARLPIVLQEHGSKVKFRNIWVLEKDGQPQSDPQNPAQG